MVFMKAKQREKRAQSSAQLKRYHAQQRALKELNAADGYGDAAMPMLIQQGGRRIIDIMLFARNMWCTDCNIPLSLRNLVKEKQFGIASRFYVRCSQCLKEIAVDSSASVPDVSKQGRSLFAVNCKAALGCIDSGVGHEQFNKLVSAINLPTISTKTMKLAEERVGPIVVSLADESCQEAIAKEKELTVRKLRNQAPGE